MHASPSLANGTTASAIIAPAGAQLTLGIRRRRVAPSSVYTRHRNSRAAAVGALAIAERAHFGGSGAATSPCRRIRCRRERIYNAIFLRPARASRRGTVPI